MLRGSKLGNARGNCEKLHFFCIFLQLYLHISNIFCTFVPYFNSGIHNDLKLCYNMEKVEICKVTIGNETYRVNQLCNGDVMLNEYRVMHNRRIQKGGSWFNNRLAAIQFMLRVAFEDVSQGTIDFEV